MFLKLAEHVQPSSILSCEYKGVVVENNDPKKLGRVKCTVEGLLEADSSYLPWCAPRNPFGLGGKVGLSGFSVPEVGSELTIKFHGRSVYAPFYIGYWQSTTTHQTDFDTDYPETYGWQDSKGNILKVNKSSGIVEFTHHSGTKFNLDNDGNVNVIVDKKEIRLGSASSSESLVLGDAFMDLYNNHVHTGNLGAPTTTPVESMMADDHLSNISKTERQT